MLMLDAYHVVYWYYLQREFPSFKLELFYDVWSLRTGEKCDPVFSTCLYLRQKGEEKRFVSVYIGDICEVSEYGDDPGSSL